MYGHVTGCSKLVSFPGTFESEAAASCRTNGFDIAFREDLERLHELLYK